MQETKTTNTLKLNKRMENKKENHCMCLLRGTKMKGPANETGSSFLLDLEVCAQ